MSGSEEFEQFENVWDALADTPEEAAFLTVLSDIMISLTKVIDRANWSRSEGARRCGLTQPRFDALRHGDIQNFTLEDVIGIATRLGCKVTVGFEEPKMVDEKLYSDFSRTGEREVA